MTRITDHNGKYFYLLIEQFSNITKNQGSHASLNYSIIMTPRLSKYAQWKCVIGF